MYRLELSAPLRLVVVANMGGLFAHETEPDQSRFEISTTGKFYNSAEEVQEGIALLLAHKDRVTELVLSRNSYGVQACEAIGLALAQCPRLVAVNLSDIFTGRLREEIPPALGFLSGGLRSLQLEELDLSDNAFGPDGVRGFSELLANMPSLKTLRLNNNGLGPEGGALVAQALLQGQKPQLEEFCAGRNRLENDGAAALGRLFGEMKSLKKVAVPQNGIKTEGFVALFAGLEQNPELQWIEVNDNCLSDEAAYSSLSRAVGRLQFLSVINVGDSLLGDAGALALLQALHASNPHLLQLNLQYNELKAEAVGDELVQLVLEKEDLEMLNIKGNEFKERTKDKIVEGLERMEKRELLAPLDSEDEEEEQAEVSGHEKNE